MKQEEKRIYDFRKGDVITRIRPMSDYGPMGDKDYNLVGKKVTFLGIANASVYFSKSADFLIAMFTGKSEFTMQLPVELCEDGWAYYVEPDFIDSESMPLDNEETLRSEIKKAVKEDDFERAEMLKIKLEEIKKSKNGRG
jgi:hypothetical protein